MKKIILLILLFLGTKSFAQTKGITYQAVILNPSGEQLPGVNNMNSPMVDKNICLQFRFIDEFSKVEYQESVQTKTDAFGMVNLVIGSGNQTGGYAASFESMEWNALKKSLIVGINTDGSCSSFTEISDQPFTAVPFAFSAINAGNVTGVVAIENGGTNAVTIIGAKTNLGLENVDNTSDLDKPMSIAAQAGWNINASGISEEVSTARAAELALTNNLATEATTARAAEGANTTAISDEATRATDAEAVLATAISDETTRAGLAEVANTEAITAEAVTARAAELANSASILAETSARTTADGLQNTAISDNALAITAETSARTTAISAEALARTTADGVQNTAISDNASAITAETSARTTADGVQNTAISDNASAITAETSARTTADGLQNTAISDNALAILAETSARTTADGVQNTAISDSASAILAETSARTAAISEEALARTNGDDANAASILAETSARTTADGLQNTAISDNASAITAETSARTTSDGVQNTAITDEAARAGLAEVANATAIGSKEDKINKSIDGTFASNSDVLFPTEKATKTYVDAQVTTATTGNFVNLTTDQNVSGKKTFNDDLNVNGQADLSMLRVNGFADIRDAFFTGSIFDVLSDATFSGMRFDVMGDAMFGGNINNLGNITSNSFIKNNGLSTQYLMADGSVSTGGSGTTITEVADEFSATATQTVFTLT
jgi:hypothetical protein